MTWASSPCGRPHRQLLYLHTACSACGLQAKKKLDMCGHNPCKKLDMCGHNPSMLPPCAHVCAVETPPPRARAASGWRWRIQGRLLCPQSPPCSQSVARLWVDHTLKGWSCVCMCSGRSWLLFLPCSAAATLSKGQVSQPVWAVKNLQVHTQSMVGSLMLHDPGHLQSYGH